MEDSQTVNYALALKNYQQKGFGRSMKRFCEENQEAGVSLRKSGRVLYCMYRPLWC